MNFEALRASTMPGLLAERARTRPERVAFRAKELGIWRETTWRELAARVAALACGLAREYRIAAGETVAIIGNPCPEWTIPDLATPALRAGALARLSRDDHLHVGNHGPSEGRRLPPRAAPGRVRQHHRALSDSVGPRAPCRRDAAALPCNGSQPRDHDAAHRPDRAALSRVGGHLRRRTLRDPADVHLHGAALPPEVRGASAGRSGPELVDQAR